MNSSNMQSVNGMNDDGILLDSKNDQIKSMNKNSMSDKSALTPKEENKFENICEDPE